MKLSEEIKQAIREEYESFKPRMYEGLTDEEREQFGMVFTPPDVTIRMIEKCSLDTLEGKSVMDPCCGSGNLLAACLIAGADPLQMYGNEYNGKMVKLCRERLDSICQKLGKPLIPEYNIHRGNAKQKRCLTTFNSTYATMYRMKYIDDPNYAQGKYRSWEEENRQAEAQWQNDHKPVQMSLFDL